MNYNCVNDEVIEGLAVGKRLRLMTIKVYRNDPHYQTISGYTWGKLRRNNSNLEVQCHRTKRAENVSMNRLKWSILSPTLHGHCH